MRYHLLFLSLLLPAPSSLLPAQQVEPKKPKPPTPLFASNDPIRIQLTTDLKAVYKDRDTTKEVWVPGTLVWHDKTDSGSSPVEVTTRGHYRLKSSTCTFSGLRIKFPRDTTKPNPLKGTLFEKQSSIKLGTHCRTGNKRYEQIPLQEFLVNRVYNMLTDSSFRVRFAHATYIDPGEKAPIEESSFFIEDDGDLADRMGMKKVEQAGAKWDDLEPPQAALMLVFAYFVGNTDFSLPYRHNIRLFGWNGRYVAVPYDFDWSGVVDAPYAVPDARLPIKTVRERTWRGPCFPADVIDGAIRQIVAKKQEIYAMYNAQEGLDPKILKDSIQYYDDFFKLVSDPRNVNQELRGTCNH